jgi:hypothetical protein
MIKIVAVCDKCGKPVTITAFQNGNVTYTHHDDCFTPEVVLMTDDRVKMLIAEARPEPE